METAVAKKLLEFLAGIAGSDMPPIFHIGEFFINSSLNNDYMMTVDLALLYAVLLIGLNLLVDFTYTVIDPRVKYE